MIGLRCRVRLVWFLGFGPWLHSVWRVSFIIDRLFGGRGIWPWCIIIALSSEEHLGRSWHSVHLFPHLSSSVYHYLPSPFLYQCNPYHVVSPCCTEVGRGLSWLGSFSCSVMHSRTPSSFRTMFSLTLLHSPGSCVPLFLLGCFSMLFALGGCPPTTGRMQALADSFLIVLPPPCNQE